MYTQQAAAVVEEAAVTEEPFVQITSNLKWNLLTSTKYPDSFVVNLMKGRWAEQGKDAIRDRFLKSFDDIQLKGSI